MPQFEPVSISAQEKYKTYTSHCPGLTSDYSFVNLWGWQEHYGLEWAFDEDLAWIRQTKPETVYWAPVGAWQTLNWREIPFCRTARHFTRVPKNLADIWRELCSDHITAEPNRDHFDYVYSVQELIDLRGNRFHKKKNLYNQFVKKNNYEYKKMEPDCVEEALAMQLEWLKWQEYESETLQAENTAIYRVLTNFDRIANLTGGAIRIDGKMVAYTVAEPVCDENMIIHFEKGNTRYKGIYQAINKDFLANTANEYKYVNREQDVGDEGLRKAKLSYNPVELLEKFEVYFNGKD